MLNPALTEMVATDRIREMRADAARRPVGRGVTQAAARQPSSRSGRRVGLAHPQQTVGWFLVSVGLRLALPRTGSAR